VRHRREPVTAPAPVVWQMAPDRSGDASPDVAAQLAEIDRRVQRIAADRPEGSDLNTMASAIHNLIECIRELHRSS